jgi:hypothetical protein
MKRLILLLTLFAVISGKLFGQVQEWVSWEPFIKMDKHLFPSYIIAAATVKFPEMGDHYIGEAKGILGISIQSTYRFAKYRLEIKSDEIADVTYYEFTLPHSKRRDTFFVLPNINYRFQQLKKINQPVPVNVTFTLYVDGKQEGSPKTETISVHSINDCPFVMTNANNKKINWKWMFAAYVNENHPIIDQILREALNTGLVDQFTDYQLATATNKDEIYRQLIAIWVALYNRKLTYSNTTTPSLATGDNIQAQHVRFIDESMNSAQANCMDGSVVFASLFRKIGIEPFLVIIPGHSFMGYYNDPLKQEYKCLETTVIGSKNISERMVDSATFAGFMNLFPKELAEKNRSAILSFTFALQTGNAKYRSIKDKLNSGDYKFQVIDIEESRKTMGVIPIAD